jgi:hypothetical protein
MESGPFTESPGNDSLNVNNNVHHRAHSEVVLEPVILRSAATKNLEILRAARAEFRMTIRRFLAESVLSFQELTMTFWVSG